MKFQNRLLVLHAVLAIMTVQSYGTDNNKAECIATMKNEFSNCDGNYISRNYTIKHICQDTAHINNTGNKSNKTCLHQSCSKQLHISIFNQQLFAITMKNAVLSMLFKCCPNCFKCHIDHLVDDLSHFDTSVLNMSDIIFPVITNPDVKKLYTFHYLPIFKVPESYFFIIKKSNNKILKEVIMSCISMWPFLLISVLFASISGFLIWVIETRDNNEHFPSSFATGMLDGFWWSFITMTTVGYGDRIPRTLIGRLYAVFWIMMGITIISVFTGTLTSEIINANQPQDTDLSGKKVGTLRYRLHDIALVAQHGGILYQGRIDKTLKGIGELIEMLENKTIDGFILDRNTYYYYYKRAEEARNIRMTLKMRSLGVLKTVKTHKEKGFTCGIMFKYVDDYNFFKSYFQNNHMYLQSCNSLRMNTEKQFTPQSNLFATGDGVTESVLYYSLGVLGVGLLVGALFEGRKYCNSLSGMAIPHHDDDKM